MHTLRPAAVASILVPLIASGCLAADGKDHPSEFPVSILVIFEPASVRLGDAASLNITISAQPYLAGGMPFEVQAKNATGVEVHGLPWCGFIEPGENASKSFAAKGTQRGEWEVETTASFENGSMEILAVPKLGVT